MKLSVVAISILSLTFFGCSSHKISISDLKELNKGEDKKCEYVKKITINSDKGDEREATHQFKKEVLDSGADSYTIDESVNNGRLTKIIGSSFICTKN